MATIVVRHRRALLVQGILALNVLVFISWLFLAPPNFMVKHFMVSWSHLEAGLYHVLLTAAFSHNLDLHLFVNMLVLVSFGSMLERILGRGPFLRFYLFAGVVSSLSHSFVSHYMLGQDSQLALGASGAIAGLVLLFSLMFPRERILVFGLIFTKSSGNSSDGLSARGRLRVRHRGDRPPRFPKRFDPLK